MKNGCVDKKDCELVAESIQLNSIDSIVNWEPSATLQGSNEYNVRFDRNGAYQNCAKSK